MSETESKKTKQKPGVRTKLNSGDKKVKSSLTSNVSDNSAAPVNPTAEAAAKVLPSMKLSTEANWAEETSASVLNAVTPVSSERSLGDNKVIPIKNSEPLIPVSEEDTEKQNKKQTKQKKKEKPKEPKVKKEPKNKYKEKKNGGLLLDLKATITQGIDSIKVDYNQLAQIQAELHSSAGDIKSTLGDRVNRIKDYANAAMANTANTVKNIEVPKFKKDETDVNYDIPKEEKQKTKPESKEIPKVNDEKAETKQPQQEKVNETTVTTEELKAAAEVSSESAKPKDDKELTQKLNQAVQRRDGAKNALNALNTQLQYTPKNQQAALKERIKQKEKQFADAEKLVTEIQQQLSQ